MQVTLTSNGPVATDQPIAVWAGAVIRGFSRLRLSKGETNEEGGSAAFGGSKGIFEVGSLPTLAPPD